MTDLNISWQAFQLSSFKSPVTILEWDQSGKILITVERNGSIKVWSMKNYEINEWIEIANCCLPGEHVLALSVFHSGRKITFANEKLEQNSYFDKFGKDKRFAASVSKIGGISANGCILVTSTGMVGAFMIPSDLILTQENPTKLNLVIESLGLCRMNLNMADLIYGKRYFYILATNLLQKPTILQCYKVKVQLQNAKLVISCAAIPSLCTAEGKGANLKEVIVHSAKYYIKDDCISVVIVMNHCYGTLIEMFLLKEQTKNLRKPFLINKNEICRTLQWVSTYSYQYNFQATSIHLSNTPFHSQYIYICTADNIMHCLRSETLKDLYQILVTSKNHDTLNAKSIRQPHCIETIVSTFLGFILLLINKNNDIFAYRLNFLFREPFLNNVSAIVSTVEYSLVNGNDYTDLLLSLKNQNLDAIIEKFNENFYRQCQSVQQFFYANFLVAKINLYRISQQGTAKVQDLNNLLTLHSTLIAFKSLLRSSDLSVLEGPSEQLALALSESLSDIDKVLANLEAKDFTVESIILQNLKQLIQWVADLALNILVRLPEQKAKAQSYDISRDIVALNSIRELLVIIRLWGLLKPQCLPNFTRSSENQDIIATLYRLLTKLSLNPSEPDEILLDECCALPSQVTLLDTLSISSSKFGLVSPALSTISTPLHLKFNQETDLLSIQSESNNTEKHLNSNYTIDFTCYLHFEKTKGLIRKCTRCSAETSTINIPRTMAIRAWEQRWPYGCRCGGFWQAIE